MSAVKFSPRVEEFVPASPPHPAGTSYRVAIGSEDWDGTAVNVEKVQMVYGGRIAGRKAPSYPVDSDDAELVRQAQVRLRKHLKGGSERGQTTLADLIGSAKGLYGTAEDVQAARDEMRGEWP